MDTKTKRDVHRAAKEMAEMFVRHPMVGTLIITYLVKHQIPVTDETKSEMLEAVASRLHRMVNGSSSED